MLLRSVAYLAIASSCVFTSVASAQDSGAPPLAPAEATAREQPSEPTTTAVQSSCCKLPALTVVELEILDQASSRTSQIGEKVRIRTAAPLLVDGRIIVPAGTEGSAEVVQASKARMMGKGGELVLGLPSLELKGQRIPLKRLRYGPSTGKGNDTLTTVAVASIGLPGLLISGGNIEISKGARANAVVTADTLLAPEPHILSQGEN